MRTSRPREWQPIDQLEPRQMLATVFWDGGAGNLSWHSPNNWSNNQLPGPGDDVVINVAGSTPTITHSQDVATSVRSIQNSEGLALTGGTISVAQDFNQQGPMTMTDGAIDGAGTLFVRGAMDWSGGQMRGAGRTVVTGSGGIDIPGTVFLGRRLFNDGVVRWQAGNIVMINGAIVNRADGEFVILGSGSMFPSSGTGLMVNDGTIRREGPASGLASIGVRLVNTGDIHAAQGTLRVLGGGVSFSGDLTTGDAGTIRFAGPTFRVLAPSSIGGPGTFAFQTGAHLLAGAFNDVGRLAVQGLSGTPLRVWITGVDRTVQALELAFGTLLIPDTLTVQEQMLWTSGSVQGPGRLRIAPGAALSINTTGHKLLDRASLEVLGTASLTEGVLRVRSGVIENKGQFTVSGQRIQTTLGTPLSTFQNSGILRKVGPGSFQMMRLVNTAAGTIDHRSGTFRITGGGLSGGTIDVAQGALLRFTTTPFSMWSGTIDGEGDVSVDTGFTWLQGTIGGSGRLFVRDEPDGTLTLSGPGARILARDVLNFGTIRWTGGTVELANARVVNHGRMLVSAGGGLLGSGTASFIENRGVFTKFGSADASFASSSVRWNNQGIINVFSGTMALNPAQVAQISGNTLTGGRWRVFSGGRLALIGSTIEHNQAEVWLQGAGASFDALDTLRSNSGTILVGNGTQTFAPTGGEFTNTGTIILAEGGDLRVTGDVVLTETSRIESLVGAPSNLGRLTATGSMSLAGTTIGRFTINPAPGAALEFLSSTDRSGEFGSVESSGLPSGLEAEVEYLPNGARWVIT